MQPKNSAFTVRCSIAQWIVRFSGQSGPNDQVIIVTDMLHLEGVCIRSLMAIELIGASFDDPAYASIRAIAEMHLAWNHILLWALVAATKNLN